MRLLANLFPMRRDGKGTLRVYPFHKSVVDWLSDAERAGGFAVDVQQGHARLGASCYGIIMSHEPQGSGSSTERLSVCAGDGSVWYAARYGVAHLCLGAAHRPELVQRLEKMVLEFKRLWERAYATGGRGRGAAPRPGAWLHGTKPSWHDAIRCPCSGVSTGGER